MAPRETKLFARPKNKAKIFKSSKRENTPIKTTKYKVQK